MRTIRLRSIPHAAQRYDTVGDYVELGDGTVRITVSDLGDERYELLVALHELVEWMLIAHRGIPIFVIDHFDMAFEDCRKPGDESEPGDAPHCPYGREHRFATMIEKMMAAELGVDWAAYEEAVHKMSQELEL